MLSEKINTKGKDYFVFFFIFSLYLSLSNYLSRSFLAYFQKSILLPLSFTGNSVYILIYTLYENWGIRVTLYIAGGLCENEQ